METKAKTGRKFGLFYKLLHEMPGYQPQYGEMYKEALVYDWSKKQTQSLSEMFTLYPKQYSEMLDYMRVRVNNPEWGEEACKRMMGNPRSYTTGNYHERELDVERKRVLAAICTYIDLTGKLKQEQGEAQRAWRRRKIDYAIAIACVAGNAGEFNNITLNKLQRIYGDFCKKNEVQRVHLTEIASMEVNQDLGDF